MTTYGTLGTLFHDAVRPAATAVEVAWYASRLPRDAGPVLDAMAGSGRLIVPLLRAGFDVHGAEGSDAMLASCERHLAGAGCTTRLYRQSPTALNLPSRYAAAFIAGGAFQLLADPVAALDALLRIRAHLVDPGLLLLDLFVPAQVAHPPGAPVVEVRTVAPAEGVQIGVRSETAFDLTQRRIEVKRRYERRDRTAITAREDDTSTLTWYSELEAVRLVRDAGYRDCRTEPLAWSAEGGRHFGVVATA